MATKPHETQHSAPKVPATQAEHNAPLDQPTTQAVTDSSPTLNCADKYFYLRKHHGGT